MGIYQGIKDFFNGRNKFNSAFMGNYGMSVTPYDNNGTTYVDKGYNYNSIIFSIINKKSIKLASIPITIREIKDDNTVKQLSILNKSTKGDYTPIQKLKKRNLEFKAFEEKLLNLPLARPNVMQTWSEFHQMYETFMSLNGNFYVYEESPDDGMNKGVPKALYILPSHLIQIVLKKDVSFLELDENPIKSYLLVEGGGYIEFDAEKVYHIKYSNPNYTSGGEHLYGQSPLRAVLRNIQSSNSGVDNNIKTLLNSGAFGFIFGKGGTTIGENQVKQIKDRLVEMDKDPSRLGKLGALSAEVGFQRISLTTEELKPFEYLSYDEKQICNALGYSDKLLNNDTGAKYDNVNQFRKQLITDVIKPDLQLLEEGFWQPFLAKFKGYEKTALEYDISELPEMQEDMLTLSQWSANLQDRGNLNADEVRDLFYFPRTGLAEHQVYTVVNDVMTLKEAIDSSFNIEKE